MTRALHSQNRGRVVVGKRKKHHAHVQQYFQDFGSIHVERSARLPLQYCRKLSRRMGQKVGKESFGRLSCGHMLFVPNWCRRWIFKMVTIPLAWLLWTKALHNPKPLPKACDAQSLS